MRANVAFLALVFLLWGAGCSPQPSPPAGTPASADARSTPQPSPQTPPEVAPSVPPSQEPQQKASTPSSEQGKTGAPSSLARPGSTDQREIKTATASAQPTETPSAVALSPAPQSVLLRLKLKPGSTYRYETVIKPESTGTPAQTLKMITKVTVKQATREGYVLVQQIEDVKSESQGRTGPEGVFQSMKNLTIETTVNEQGKVLKQNVQTEDPFVKQILQSIGSPGSSLSPTGMNFPNKPVQVGTRWSDKLGVAKMLSETLKTFGPISPSAFDVNKDEITYEVKAIRQKGSQTVVVVEVKISADIGFKIQPPSEAKSQQPLTGAIKTTSSGTMEISADTGLLLSAIMDTVTETRSDTFTTEQKMKTEMRMIP
ncbi:MAG: hypothetical protein K6T17_02430 [Fimbriimonadales bacterium]|nr:hypothetical protein [Fimbriimonadales bacterium]